MSLHVRGPLVALVAAVGLLVATTVLLVIGQRSAADAAVSPGTTVRASVRNDGSQATGGGSQNALSADGRFVAFQGVRLDPRDAESDFTDVYVRDLVGGTTTLISTGPEGAPGRGNSSEPSISADGRYIAYTTEAGNISDSAGDGRSAIVVCDRGPSLNAQCATTTVSVLPPDVRVHGEGGEQAHSPRLSADAGRIAWLEGWGCYSSAVQQDTLVATTLHKAANGALSAPAATDSVNETMPLPDSRTEDFCDPALSADGSQLLASVRYQSDLTDGEFYAIVSNDLRSKKVTRLDVGTDGNPLDSRARYFEPTTSRDGGRVAFTSLNAAGDEASAVVHLVDRATGPGAVTKTSVASKDLAGAEHDGRYPALSADGHYLAFATDSPQITESTGTVGPFNCFHPEPIGLLKKSAVLASSSAPGPTFQACQVVVVNLVTSQHPELASAGLKSAPGDGDSVLPVLAGDGSSVAFDSDADDLVTGDTNKARDSFVRTFQPGMLADPVDFGSVTIGQTAEQTVTVHHTAFGPLSFDQVTVNGAPFSVGGQTCTTGALNGVDTCLVTVRFSPTDTVARTGTLTLRAKGSGRLFTVALKGVGTPVVQRLPSFAASPDPLDFGQQLPLAKNVQKTVTVVNGGASALVVTGVSVVSGTQNGDFSVVTNGCTSVQPGQSCQVVVRFSPTGRLAAATTPDQRTAALKFDDNAVGSPHLVALSGSVAIPSIKLSPEVGAPGAVITVTGTGFAPSSGISVRYAGGFPESATSKTDGNGGFTTSLLVFPLSELGPRTVQASVDGANPGVTGNADLLVTPGSLTAPDYDYRH
ncbi:choice-of-anchor D domain-containing protein [Kutzneria buriramensis]|uniref:WD40 repeat protein n=1 Tax=Kutzneria buriramensis TaxID=1045776 RepID=A0A3E0I5V0_9PSEU|nr:choice-of-anchor D domain-containing protein [Kutzneria buriramensis]REH54113.1 WD40 repeat protein [Kutzneria buriramensis]